jgi:hypothetical protein
MPFDAIPTNDTIQKLEQVHQLLSRRGGWCKCYLSIDNGRKHCLVGASNKVGLHPTEMLRAFGFLRTNELTDWNDQPSRKKYQVLNFVQEAIDRERERLLV